MAKVAVAIPLSTVAALAATAARPRVQVGLTLGAASSSIALLVYLRTLATSIPAGDSGDLITAACLLGVPHPPGYPLHTLLGSLFCALPGGSPAMKVNLLSAVLHALAVGLTSGLIYRLVTDAGQHATTPDRRWLAAVVAIVGGLMLAFSPAFWRYALVAEVFALNSVFAALLLLLLAAWERQPDRTWLFRGFALTCGLAASNHHTIVLLAPALLVLLWSGARKLQASSLGWRRIAREITVAAGLILVGLLPYAYLPLAASRDPALNWNDPQTLDRFVRHVSRADYGTFSLARQDGEASGSRLEQIALLGAHLSHGFTPPGCLLAVLGLWWLLRHRPPWGLAVALAFLGTGPAFVAYANPAMEAPVWKGVMERFYILPDIPFAVAVGAGGFAVLGWLAAPGPRAMTGRRIGMLAALGLLALPAALVLIHRDALSQADNVVPRHYVEDLFMPIEPGALLLLRGDMNTFPAEYLQLVEGYRPDVVTLDIEKLGSRAYVQQMRRRHPHLPIPFEAYDGGRRTSLAALVAANIDTRPVYLVGNPPDEGLRAGYEGVRAGLADRIVSRGAGIDTSAILRDKVELFARLRYPTRSFPDSTFEHAMARNYGVVASQVAFTLHVSGRVTEAEALYRTAIRLAPDQPAAYKNLGALLLHAGRDRAEVAGLWQEYLRLVPDDPDAPGLHRLLDAASTTIP